jgi:hypothetical protein
MGILRTNTISGLGTDGAVFQGVTKFDTQGYVVPSSGTTDQRSAGITTTQGAIRFNTDSQKLEFYAQDQWWEMVIDTPALGTSSDTGAGARGVIRKSNANNIEYVNISSTGNSVEFGDTTDARQDAYGVSSSTRGLFGSGYYPASPTWSNVIDYITIASTGDALDFGDLSTGKYVMGGCSNSTRGLYAGGFRFTSPTIFYNAIEYITIASTGDAQTFGDLTVARWGLAGVSSPVRGVFGSGGIAPNSSNSNIIDYITIASLGNAQDFGDLNYSQRGTSGCSNATRGIFAGGYDTGGTHYNTIEYITISTTGNSQNFGDLTAGRNYAGGGFSSSTRGCFAGGRLASSPGPFTNIIDYITIQTEGNAVDFGDINWTHYSAGLSNAHGGL